MLRGGPIPKRASAPTMHNVADQTALSTPADATAQPEVHIEVCEQVSDELVAAFARLHPQLSSSPPPDAAALGTIVAHPATTVLIARHPVEFDPLGAVQADPGAIAGVGVIAGAMVLVMFPLPSGLRAWIEDVVVDKSARGRGIGASLNRHAIGIARRAGARTVDLTSRPDREAANRLYARLGFVQRDTNVYRLEF